MNGNIARIACPAFMLRTKNSQMSEDDSPLKILAVASKPLAFPPFPLERIEELTKIMGGCGDVGGYYHEQRK